MPKELEKAKGPAYFQKLKNYCQFFVVPIFEQPMPPPAPPLLHSRNVLQSIEEAQDFIDQFDTSTGLFCGQIGMYYFLLNKLNVHSLVQAFSFPMNADGTIFYVDHAPFQQITQDKDLAQGYNTESDAWGYDTGDERSVKAEKAAKTIIKSKVGGQDLAHIIIIVMTCAYNKGSIGDSVYDEGSQLLTAFTKGKETQSQVDSFFANAKKIGCA